MDILDALKAYNRVQSAANLLALERASVGPLPWCHPAVQAEKRRKLAEYWNGAEEVQHEVEHTTEVSGRVAARA